MKPRCRSIQRYLSDYIDRTLSRRQTVAVAQHLRFCHGCRDEVKSLRNTKALLHYYVAPTSPDGYDSLFWQQLQQVIEENARPTWWRMIVRSLSFVWGSPQVFDRCCYFLNSLIGHPIQWGWRLVRLSPAYAYIILVTLATLLAYQGLQTDRHDSLNPTSLPQFLNASPSYLTHVEGNRKLVRGNLEKISRIPSSSPVQFEHKTLRQSNLTDLTTKNLDWKGNPSSSGNDSEELKEIIAHDTYPDSLAFAQLLTPESILAREDFALPLRVVITPPIKFEREPDQSNSFVIKMLADVPLPGLSLAKVYDSVKL